MRGIFRLLRRTYSPECGENNSDNILVLIDLYDHRRGGHFGSWLKWFALEFSKRFDRVVVVTPVPNVTSVLFAGDGETRTPNIHFAKLPKRHQRNFDLNGILRRFGRVHGRAAGFVMWGYDLLGCGVVRQTKYPWGTLFGISWRFRGNENENSAREGKLLEIVESRDSCRGFFQPDFYLRDRHEKGVWITDVEVTATCESETPLLRSIREFRKETLSVGVFGMLHGFRCVDEILLLAREQQDVNFVIAGKVFCDGVRKDLVGDLESGRCDNLLVYPNFIESELELNAAIRSVDAVFIDGGHYPVQSGIVCKALHFGKWILSSSGDSWTNDVIAETGAGFTYPTRDVDLIQRWEDWQSDGGENRSRDYSKRLRDPSTVKKCFDEIAARLLDGDIFES